MAAGNYDLFSGLPSGRIGGQISKIWPNLNPSGREILCLAVSSLFGLFLAVSEKSGREKNYLAVSSLLTGDKVSIGSQEISFRFRTLLPAEALPDGPTATREEADNFFKHREVEDKKARENAKQLAEAEKVVERLKTEAYQATKEQIGEDLPGQTIREETGGDPPRSTSPSTSIPVTVWDMEQGETERETPMTDEALAELLQ